ncbi:preprotein translocase subunit SecE [Ectothiorhodospiraceae bacterium 2226]|nr:preprotein translocase subunit SecE [Ectothiorhodospiraceae bacterium 2226]
MADRIKMLAALLVLGSGIVMFYVQDDAALVVRVLMVLVAAAVAGGIASQTQAGGAAITLGRGAVTEMRKVVWPNRKETLQSTGVVLIMVILVGILLWLFDMFLLWAVRLLTGQGG